MRRDVEVARLETSSSVAPAGDHGQECALLLERERLEHRQTADRATPIRHDALALAYEPVTKVRLRRRATAPFEQRETFLDVA